MSKRWTVAILMFCAAGLQCAAQIPDAGAALVAVVPKTQVEAPKTPVHRFFDKTNLSLSAMTLSAAMADGITTQHALGLRRTRTTSVNGVPMIYSTTYVERNPIAAPLVNRGWPGQLAATALTAGADLGIRNWLHRTGHHRAERIVPFVFAATSASFAAHNAKYW